MLHTWGMECKRLVTVHGLALELRLPRAWLIAEADEGRLPSLLVGRRRLFNVEAVRQALAERAATAPFDDESKVPQ